MKKYFKILGCIIIGLAGIVWIFQQNNEVTALVNSAWNVEIVDSSAGKIGKYPSMALDSEDKPHIAYYDPTFNQLKYGYKNGNTWHTEYIENTDVANGNFSLATDSTNTPHIVHQYNASQLAYIYLDNHKWISHTTQMDILFVTPSLAIGTDDSIHVSYRDIYGLKYAYWQTNQWISQTVEARSEIWGELLNPSLSLDSNNRPHISYYEQLNSALKYAFWDGTEWIIQTVDNNGNVGIKPSLAIDAKDVPHISYYDGLNKTIKYSYRDGSQWKTYVIKGDEITGQESSIMVDSQGIPHISYHVDNELRYGYFNGANWIISTIDSGNDAGKYSSLSINSTDALHISYYKDADYPDQGLKYAEGNPVSFTYLSGMFK